LDSPPAAFLFGPEQPEPARRTVSVPWLERVVNAVRNQVHEDHTVWYFLHDGQVRGHAYLVGYDVRSKQKAGYLGRHGFRSDEPPLEDRFPVAGDKMLRSWQILVNNGAEPEKLAEPLAFHLADCCWLLADDGLIRINLKERTVHRVRKEEGLVSAQVLFRPGSRGALSSDERFIATILVRTPQKVLMLDLNSGKELGSYALPAELRTANIQWFQISADSALSKKAYSGDELFWLDATGRIVRRELVRLEKPPQPPKIVEDITVSVAAPSPAVIFGALAFIPWHEPDRPQSLDYGEAFLKALYASKWIFLITGGVSIVLACLCYRRQRRYGLPWPAAWTVLVLLVGLPAYLGYRCHREWPVRLPCPSCGRPTPRDREGCLYCGRELPSPAPKGIEVFA
jgi:hypothetical protein